MILKKLSKDTLIYGGADFISKSIAFLFFPLIANVISTESFGILEIVLTSITLIGLFVGHGMNNSVQRFYWDDKINSVEKQKIVSTAISIQITNGIVLILIFSLILFIYGSQLAESIPYISVLGLYSAIYLISLTQWNQFILDVIRIHFKPWYYFFVNIFSRGFSIAFGFFLLYYLNYGINGLLIGQSLIILIILPFGLYLIKKDIRLSAITKSWRKQLIDYGQPFIYAGIAYWLFSSMDRWMLLLLNSADEVGKYSVSFRLVTILFFISTAFGQAWSPIAIKIKTDDPKNYKKSYSMILYYFLLVMILFGSILSLFCGEIYYLLFPEDYLYSSSLLIILSFAIVFYSTQQITVIGISLTKKTKILAKLSWIIAVINFILNLILIPNFGSYGAAFSTLISCILLTSIYLYYTQKLIKLPIKWKLLFSLIFTYILIAVASYLLINYYLDKKLIIIKFIILIILLLYLLKLFHYIKNE